ncbi:alpha/beta hydrolase [Falsiroseomonas sp. E2-1-a20]|uniref:alpha/beta hydrolase n=1 Tax=Falsiroseomonas sp. E2-1-a20 TaxID=3239300 RepID=UPI003F3EE8CA
MLVPDLAYGPLPRHRLDLTLPPMPGPETPLVVFFHGGGWETGSRKDYAFLARTLAVRGIAVAVPDYRLWPEARWPDFVEDAALAMRWLRTAPQVPRGPAYAMGHSAGGFLAASLALDPGWGVQPGLAGGILLAAPIWWQPDYEPIISIFAEAPGGLIQATPDRATLAGAPPMLLLHGLADTVVGPFHTRELTAALQAASRPVRAQLYEDVGHIGIMAALAAPLRTIGLAAAPVYREVLDFVGIPAG